MSTKLYADNRCIAEFFSANELREMAGHDPIEPKEEKKICNCPNCGAPITNYICEYCGTIFDLSKPYQTSDFLNDQRQKLLDKIAELELAKVQYSQQAQTSYLMRGLYSMTQAR